MATTGQQFARLIRQKIDQSYSLFYDDARLNRLIKESIFRGLEKDYLALSTQKEYDELRNFLKTNVEIDLVNSSLYLDPIQISNAVFVGATPTTATITTAKPHYLQDNQQVTISGIIGITPNPNVVATITNVTTNTFEYDYGTGAVSGTYTPNSGIVTPNNIVPNYNHYLYSEAKILEQKATITAVQTGSQTIITTSSPHYLRTNDIIDISGVVGVTGINTQHTITVLNSTKIRIGTTSGTYVSGGAISLVYQNQARLYRSDQKGFVFAKPTNDSPKYSIGDGIMFYTPTTQSVLIDYVTELPIEIDVTDTVIDLELYFPYKFLTYLADECVLNAGAQMRDMELQQSATAAIINNP